MPHEPHEGGPRTQPPRGGEAQEVACSDIHEVHPRIKQLERENRRRCKEALALKDELDAARVELAELRSCAPAPPSIPMKPRESTPRGPVSSPVSSDPAPPPTPQLRKYDTEGSRKRAVKKLRSFLMLYPADSQADLVARAVVVDRRGRKSGLSVSLVKELLKNPRMKYEMKRFAETVLEGARLHMMQAVYSASNLTTARSLLKLSYRKLEWLRRTLSHKGKSKRVMHPDYDTGLPVFPSVPDMKADVAAILDAHGGIAQPAGRWAGCSMRRSRPHAVQGHRPDTCPRGVSVHRGGDGWSCVHVGWGWFHGA